MHACGRRNEVACRRSILAPQDESILVCVQENEGRRFFFPLQESHWRPYSHRNPHSFHHCKQAITWDKSKLVRVVQRTQCPFLKTNKLCKKKLDKKPFFGIPSREKSGETSDESKFQNQQNIGNLDLQGNPRTNNISMFILISPLWKRDRETERQRSLYNFPVVKQTISCLYRGKFKFLLINGSTAWESLNSYLSSKQACMHAARGDLLDDAIAWVMLCRVIDSNCLLQVVGSLEP